MSDRYCTFEQGKVCYYYRRDGARYGYPVVAYCIKYEMAVKDIKACKKSEDIETT